ncbi:MAG: hypothetical protein M3376_11265 [Actinomycetota bacterium]|nr:hypothetical protein [Actinomycetota bacterium]
MLPLLALHLTHPHGALAVVEAADHWVVWRTFMVEVVVMLCVVRDRRVWVDGHRFELLAGGDARDVRGQPLAPGERRRHDRARVQAENRGGPPYGRGLSRLCDRVRAAAAT